MSKKGPIKNNLHKFHKFGLWMEEEVLTNIPNFSYESKLKTCNNEYLIEIKFDESRAKHQAWFTHKGKKTSLSFFDLPKIAKENILRTIAFMNGYSGGNQNQSQVGD